MLRPRRLPVASRDAIEFDNGDFRYVPTEEVIPRTDGARVALPINGSATLVPRRA
jgi:hypothetical protein